MSFLLTMSAVALARTIGGCVQRFTSHIFPFHGSSDEEKMMFQSQLTSEQQKQNQTFQLRLQEQGFKNQEKISYISLMMARQTTFMSNIQNCQNSMKSRMFDEVLRNYPLNIPPIVMLQNAGIPLDNITGDIIGNDPLTKSVLDMDGIKEMSEDLVMKHFERELHSNPVALSVFITPLQVDSRVAAKEKVASVVWNDAYQKIESLFINEYNRNGERPVIFYPSAWNQNAKPGLHAAEILYFFTKEMPVVVLEPRFDGKELRVMMSCWGIGLLGNQHVRQEIKIGLDWNQVIMEAVHERSKRGLDAFDKMNELPPLLVDIRKRLEHNVLIYEKLMAAGGASLTDVYDDCTKLFYTNNTDYSVISDTVASSLEMLLCAISDVHHLVSRNIEPHFGEIRDSYFGEALSLLSTNELNTLNRQFRNLYSMAYSKVMIGGLPDTPTVSTERKKILSLFGDKQSTMLETVTEGKDKVVTPMETSAIVTVSGTEIVEEEEEEIEEMVGNYCERNGIANASLPDMIYAIDQKGDSVFIERLKVALKDGGLSYEKLLSMSKKAN